MADEERELGVMVNSSIDTVYTHCNKEKANSMLGIKETELKIEMVISRHPSINQWHNCT